MYGVLPTYAFAGTASVCPDDTIRQVTSPLTEMAEVDLSMADGGITQRMKLPVGRYQYETNDGDGSTCLVSIEIKGVLQCFNLVSLIIEPIVLRLPSIKSDH